MTTEERLAVLETGQKTLFKQVDEVKETVNEIHRLASSMEVVAAETKNISTKVDDINDRLSEVEKAPAKAFTHYKQLIIGCIATGVVGALLGAILALVLK